jgi:hypothetical protein
MPMTQAERKQRADIRAARRALVKAYHAAHLVRKRLKYLGPIGKVDPGHPPGFPNAPCGPLGKMPGKPSPITMKRFEASVAKIEVYLGNSIKVFDRMFPKQPPGR